MGEGYCKERFLIVLSAPSGGGKTTICRAILERMSSVDYSISYTTRKPRYNEKDGVDYFFVGQDKFNELIISGDLLEYAKVHDNWYGTSRSFIQERFSAGKHVIMDIDVQGAESIIKNRFKCVTIFLLPPNLCTLEQRLKARKTDSDDVIKLRLKNAACEIKKIPDYNYLVINDRLETAINEVQEIIRAEENNTMRYVSPEAVFYGG